MNLLNYFHIIQTKTSDQALSLMGTSIDVSQKSGGEKIEKVADSTD
jgi:hypothetical protein